MNLINFKIDKKKESVTGYFIFLLLIIYIKLINLYFIFKCSSREGRDLIVHHNCIAQMITNTSALLSSNNSWIASNAALVLAR